MVEHALGESEGRYGSLVRVVFTWVMVLVVLFYGGKGEWSKVRRSGWVEEGNKC